MAKLTAKQRYYNNQAKKGKISASQASSMGTSNKNKKVTLTPTKKVTASKATSNIGPVASGSAYGAMLAPVQGPTLPNGAFYSKQDVNSPMNKTVATQRSLASKSTKNTKNTGGSSSSVKKSSIGPVKTNQYQHPTNPGADVADPFGVKKQTGLAPAKTGISGLLGRLSGGMRNLMGAYGEMIGNHGSIMDASNKGTAQTLAEGYDNTFNIPKALAADMPTGYGNNGEIFYNNNTTPGLLRSDVATPGTDFSRPGSEEAYLTKGTSPIAYGNTTRNSVWGGNTPQYTPPKTAYNDIFSRQDARGSQDYRGDNRPSNRQAPEQAFGQNPFGDMQTMAPLESAMQDMTPQQRTTGAVPRTFGAGAFGNGKGVGNPAEQDPYIRELRKSLKGYSSQEDDVMKQFEDLIKSLDPTYDQYKKEGQQALDEQQNTDLNRLASVMNAGNVGDSEQRTQAMQRTQNQYSQQLMNLLAKLAMQKNQDIQGYREKSVDAVNSVRDRAMSARERIAQLIKQAQDDEWERNYKMSQDARSGSSGSRGLTPLQQAQALQKLKTAAANMSEGGANWAQQNAPLYGISGDVSPYFQGNWGDGFREAPSNTGGGDTIQELASQLGVDYATAKALYLDEAKNGI